MADSTLTPEQIFILERYADALNTLATALGQLTADEIVTAAEARAILVRVGVLTEQDIKDIETQKGRISL